MRFIVITIVLYESRKLYFISYHVNLFGIEIYNSPTADAHLP